MTARVDHARAPETRPPRRLVALIGTLLGFESLLWSVVTPILPHYAQTLGVSKSAIGVLTGAYAAGLIPGSFLSWWLAARAGVRRATLAGMLTFAATAAPFGFAHDIVLLDALRAAQGIGCGFIWGGALTWVIAASPASRRGRVFGSAFSAAIVGMLLGPAIGTATVAVGTEVTFGALGAVALGLAVVVRSYPAPAYTATTDPRVRLSDAVRNRAVLLGTWLVLLEAIATGVAYTLIPLRLSRLGASTAAIGATFFVTAALSAVISIQIGRVSDRRGAIGPIVIGLALGAAMTVVLPLPHSIAALAILTVLALAGPLTVFIIPGSALLTVAVERAGISLVVGTLLFNLMFALGQTISAPAGAALAQATSDAVPFAVIAVLLLATLGLVLAWRGQAQVADAATATGHTTATDSTRAAAAGHTTESHGAQAAATGQAAAGSGTQADARPTSAAEAPARRAR